jgi:hypothetical protein
MQICYGLDRFAVGLPHPSAARMGMFPTIQ